MLDIKDYEAMSKLCLPEEERALLSARAEALTKSFDELAAVDTEGVTPLVTVLDIQNVLREDKTSKIVTREELLSGAPEQYDGYFQVPKTLFD